MYRDTVQYNSLTTPERQWSSYLDRAIHHAKIIQATGRLANGWPAGSPTFQCNAINTTGAVGRWALHTDARNYSGPRVGDILAKVRGVPRILLDLVGLLLGLITILLAVASIMTDSRLVTVQDKVQDLLLRTANWVGIAMRQEMSDDLLVFILSLALVCWVLAYSSAYFVFKSRQLWWALVPCGVALLINLSYATVNLNSYIIIFMFSALLLMIRFNLLMQEERWQRERINYSPTLTWGFLWAGSLASLMLAGAMWFVPTTAVNSTLNTMWNKVNQPWVDFQTRMSALWSQVPGNQADRRVLVVQRPLHAWVGRSTCRTAWR